MIILRLLAGLLLAGWALPVVAQTWETMHGERVEGRISGMYGPLVSIAGKKGSRFINVSELNDAGVEGVAEYLAGPGKQATPWNGSGSKVAKALKGRLQILRDEKLVEFDPGTRKEPEFYLVYFGADWCPPCRSFSPKLVASYNRLKRMAPEAFELVFISSDRAPSEQLKYVRHVGMPWPVLKYSQLGRAEPLEQWAAKGIPNLVVVTREGEMIYHSYRGAEYLGPASVLESFDGLLNSTRGGGGATKRQMHRLAVVQHVRAATGGSATVAPYVIDMNLARYKTLENEELMASLTIDEKGVVQDVTIEPKLSAVLEHQLVNDAGTWLFLPAVKDGKAIAAKATLPLKLR